jgi:hypothetical protein
MSVATGGAAAGMPGLPEVWQWQEQLVGFGTRYTGSSGHAAYADWLTIPTPVTPPGGVTGRLVDLGLYPVASGYTEAFWAPARGGIALDRAAPPVFSLDLAQTATGGYVPGRISALAAIEYAAYAAGLMNPVFQGIFEPVPLLDARNAGVPGVVVAWTGVPDDEVVNQYNPFTTSYPAASGLPAAGDPGCPAVLGRRLAWHRAGRTGRGRPGQRHARAHRRYHRGRGDRDGLGLAGRLGGHRREHHHQHPHRRAERD